MCFHVIAHRGASAYAPENTLAAFAIALELGAREIEMDTQLSSDGVVMLFHDALLDEKTNLNGPVSAHREAELLEADIGTWFDATHPDVGESHAGTKLNRFADALTLIGERAHYHIELKSLEAELPAKVIDALSAAKLLERATLTSFDYAQVERAQAQAPTIPVCWLLRSEVPEPERRGAALLSEQRSQLARASEAEFEMVAIRVNQLSREIVLDAEAAGLQLRAYGIKSDADMERAIELGASGMTTNWPDKLLARMAR